VGEEVTDVAVASLFEAVQRPDWFDDAACKGMDTNLWFPEANEPDRAGWRARAVCSGCSVKDQCLDWSNNSNPIIERFGIWGGKGERARRLFRRHRREAREAALAIGAPA
jgi:WhiB family redox-sensing transcriptional regulator